MHKIIYLLLFVSVLLFTLNIFLRTPLPIPSETLSKLKTIYGEDYLNSINYYNGGIISWGSTKTLCHAVYFSKSFTRFEALSNKTNYFEVLYLSLVHETFHTYQFKTIPRCIIGSINSVYHQLYSFLVTGSRSNAYAYTLYQTTLNVEQEATIVQDYYYLAFQNGTMDYISCNDCELYGINKTKQLLKEKKEMLFRKYA